jgi:hypothetical protein
MKRAQMMPDSEPGSDFVVAGEENELAKKPVVQIDEPLTADEITDIRWLLFGKCPICGNFIKDWSPGPFNPDRYKYWHDNDIDAVSGHKMSCSEKWRRAP